LFEEAATRMNGERAAREVATWQEVIRKYRVIMFEYGEEQGRDEVKKRAGISLSRVKKVLASGGELSEVELGWCRTRYFVDGLVIGSASFVDQVFAISRENFGKTRESGARRMRRVTSSLCTMRDLQKDVLRC
jgi:hypothetical protein